MARMKVTLPRGPPAPNNESSFSCTHRWNVGWSPTRLPRCTCMCNAAENEHRARLRNLRGIARGASWVLSGALRNRHANQACRQPFSAATEPMRQAGCTLHPVGYPALQASKPTSSTASKPSPLCHPGTGCTFCRALQGTASRGRPCSQSLWAGKSARRNVLGGGKHCVKDLQQQRQGAGCMGMPITHAGEPNRCQHSPM